MTGVVEVVAVQTMSALLIASFEDGTARTLSGIGPVSYTHLTLPTKA